jgi:hypothetical protein
MNFSPTARLTPVGMEALLDAMSKPDVMEALKAVVL